MLVVWAVACSSLLFPQEDVGGLLVPALRHVPVSELHGGDSDHSGKHV